MAQDFPRRRLLQFGGIAAASVVLSGPRPFSASGPVGMAAASEATPAPTGMLTDLLPQALGTGAGQNPRFSWQVPDLREGTVQRAYQLQLAATPGGFEDDDQVVWDSGKQDSVDSTAVPYGGPALKPRTAYWWRVRSWVNKRSAWSEPVLLATSVEDEWEAKPIWVPAGPVMTDGTFTVRVKITAVAAGLWFRATSTANNYMWQLRAGTTGVLRKHVCVNGTYTVLGEVKLPFAVTVGEWVDLRVTMTGATFTTTVDGTVVDTATDSRYASGNVGLRNGSTESQTYDRVTFTAADGTVLLDDDFASDKGTFATGTVSGGVLTFPTGASSLSAYGADDTWALLRHEYDTKAGKEIAAAILYVAATSPDPARQYVAKVWSNGTTVGYASVRSGAGTAYQAFDVTSTLRADGKANALAALCWTTSQQKFLAQLEITYTDGSRSTVASGDGWRARRQAGLLPSKGSAGSSYFTVPQEYWDLRREPVGWTKHGFDDGDWVKPVVRTAIDGLVPALIEAIRPHDVTPASVTEVADGRWLVDLGREIVGGLALEVTGGAGDTVEVRLGEELNTDGTVKYQLRATNTYREVWTLRDGEQRFEHWGYRGFRWAELRTTLDLSKAVVTGRAWKLDWNDSDASFRSSDADLDRVWELCRYSIEATRGDLYTDTPTRERGPYEGDALINQLSEYGVQRSYALARWSNDYLVRKGTWPTEYRLMCAISAWEDYLATGDDRQLAKDYDLLTAKNLTSYLDSQGLVRKAAGSTSQDLGDLVDWPAASRDGYVFTNVNTVVNAFQYAAFEALAGCAAALGKDADATALRGRADTLATAMRSTLLDSAGGRFLDGVGTTHSAQHATAFPVALGVADALDDKVLSRLGDTLAAGGMKVSVYGSQFLLDALFRLGRSDAALALLTSTATNSWLHMLDALKATIVTEAWDPALKSNMTLSHAWASAPANAVARHILGVQVTEPGAAGFRIRPRTGSLTEVDGTVPSLRGPVSVQVQRSGDTHTTRVTLPPNSSAVLEVEIGDAAPKAYRVKAVTPRGEGSAKVESFTDLTGTVLRIGPLGSGTTEVRRKTS
ncbi:family 78 glycoside hydrolase catalytic domain [Streptomyces europaeiscabiei]|uniref:family 78 glycoside hydrolase catalytic domain n=1 Tax=Streptomyces europaeiscabiei TaxID=146819 RepID=UPI0029A4189D|nr:family 78 glycoside hydrolase catalytic domain [Streptomyces europaeiscabiei]MDX3865950.1 family 78 glycoside hydrolase catalytic domain [Streptomyces europaeiscabiei]MDX3875160.1 family 78 glycoside hydrolase catalytic domain [Streptomyces europaeiscabiei]